MDKGEQHYAVVQFEDNGIQLLPSTWLTEDSTEVRWPDNFKNDRRFCNAVKNFEPWQETWQKYRIKKILGTSRKFQKNTYKNIYFCYME